MKDFFPLLVYPTPTYIMYLTFLSATVKRAAHSFTVMYVMYSRYQICLDINLWVRIYNVKTLDSRLIYSHSMVVVFKFSSLLHQLLVLKVNCFVFSMSNNYSWGLVVIIYELCFKHNKLCMIYEYSLTEYIIFFKFIFYNFF